MGGAKASMLVGRIGGAYGIKGWVRVKSFTDPQDSIFAYAPWQLHRPLDGKLQRMGELLEGKPHGKGLIVRLEGVTDRDEAESLRGLEIRVDRARLPRLEAGQFYWSDLEGLKVQDQNGNELGCVDHLLDTGANDVLVIQGKDRHLIPFVYGDTVTAVDLDAGCITVVWEADDQDQG
jgi:16S rRNA processing protein RimM